jgi:Tfp pilus assembly protein PilV
MMARYERPNDKYVFVIHLQAVAEMESRTIQHAASSSYQLKAILQLNIVTRFQIVVDI